MIEFLSDPHVWASLLTLTALEIVLGIDNLIFLSIVSGRLPQHQQRLARQIGLALALLGRIALLFSLTWIIGLTEPLLTLAGFELSWRDIVLSGGGLFLLVKGTMETHHMLEGHEEGASEPRGRGAYGQGQLHRHLRAGSRSPALYRALSPGAAAGRSPAERASALGSTRSTKASIACTRARPACRELPLGMHQTDMDALLDGLAPRGNRAGR
jgi:hypothetical protein